jgi:phosphate starvation-inducible protein PhoH
LASPINADKEGFLPGDTFSKGAPYYMPFFQALRRIGVNANTAVHSEDLLNEKTGSAFITCMTDTYIRGMNVGEVGRNKNTVYIVEEAANFTSQQLVRALTRVCEGSLTVCIGHSLQCDLPNKTKSGFAPMLEHFRGQPWCEICTLTENYRGDVSRWADQFKG